MEVNSSPTPLGHAQVMEDAVSRAGANTLEQVAWMMSSTVSPILISLNGAGEAAASPGAPASASSTDTANSNTSGSISPFKPFKLPLGEH